MKLTKFKTELVLIASVAVISLLSTGCGTNSAGQQTLFGQPVTTNTIYAKASAATALVAGAALTALPPAQQTQVKSDIYLAEDALNLLLKNGITDITSATNALASQGVDPKAMVWIKSGINAYALLVGDLVTTGVNNNANITALFSGILNGLQQVAPLPTSWLKSSERIGMLHKWQGMHLSQLSRIDWNSVTPVRRL